MTFKFITSQIVRAYTARGLKHVISLAGLRAPATVTSMFQRGESPEYILTACLACETIGA